MSRSRPSFLKRKWIVNPKLQYGMMLYFGFGIALLFMISYFGTSMAANTFHTFCSEIPTELIDKCQDALNTQRSVIRWILTLGGAAGVIFIFAGTMIATNRAAGPIFRAIKYLESYERGEISQPLSFRRDDHYPELAEAINRALDAARGRKP